jgi:hypothetical protein
MILQTGTWVWSKMSRRQWAQWSKGRTRKGGLRQELQIAMDTLRTQVLWRCLHCWLRERSVKFHFSSLWSGMLSRRSRWDKDLSSNVTLQNKTIDQILAFQSW